MSGKKKWKARYNDMFEACFRAETDLRHEQQKFYEAQHEGSVAQARVRDLEEELAALDGLLSVAERERDERVSPGVHQGFVQEVEALREEVAQERRFKAEWMNTALGLAGERNRLKDQLAENGDEPYKYEVDDEGKATRIDVGSDTEKIPTVDVSEFMQVPTWHGLPDPRGKIEDARRAEMHDAVTAALNDARGPHEAGCTQDPMHTGQCHVAPAKSAIEYVKPETDEGEGMLIAYVPAMTLEPGDRIRFYGTGKNFVTVLTVHDRGYKRVDLLVRIPRNDADPSKPYGDHSFTLEHNAVVERNENP